MGRVHSCVKYSCSFMLSVVYGSNNRVVRRQLWDSLRQSRQMICDEPWLVGGDFNIVKSFSKSVGGVPDSGAMSEFNNCVRDVELVENPHSGSQFSWSRNWKEQGVLRNLDRLLCNHGWFEKYRASMVNVVAPSDFDHCSLNHTSFQGIVSKFWEKDIVGDGMFVLHCKLKEIKKELKRLNCDELSNIRSKVKEKCIELEIANEKVYGGCLDVEHLARVVELTKDYERLCKAERELYQSKAKTSWYKDGNASTSLFHKVSNVINQGIELFIFKMSTSDNSFDITQIVSKSITEEEAIMLSKQINVEEIEEAMLNMKMGKAPGPDGFTAEFYKDVCPTVKQSVYGLSLPHVLCQSFSTTQQSL
ncbi:hypothetical protein LIER_03202 [Lithospermum erythrorhizon]|uniref:Non-LTR retroelement reverse transcriptase n=1 Tax=Lithospermum erythrorhizon TaxID=34254 RepID=A0AAV3NSE1_LITER